MGFLGSRFAAREQALAPLLEEIARRALLIVAPISAIVERNAGAARAAEARR